MTGIEILDNIEWYAMTNMGTGPTNPHSVILRINNHTGSGTDETSIETAIQNAYKDLQKRSAS